MRQSTFLPQGPVRAIAFDWTGHHMATAGADGEVKARTYYIVYSLGNSPVRISRGSHRTRVWATVHNSPPPPPPPPSLSRQDPAVD